MEMKIFDHFMNTAERRLFLLADVYEPEPNKGHVILLEQKEGLEHEPIRIPLRAFRALLEEKKLVKTIPTAVYSLI
jgi:hypothetical protein